MSNRERLVSIDVRDNGMLVETLRRPQEVRESAEYFEDIPEGARQGDAASSPRS